jgi:hypothetical protein
MSPKLYAYIYMIVHYTHTYNFPDFQTVLGEVSNNLKYPQKLHNSVYLFIYLTTSSLAHIMAVLNQQTGTIQEYEIIPFVIGTSTLLFSITNISEKMCEI